MATNPSSGGFPASRPAFCSCICGFRGWVPNAKSVQLVAADLRTTFRKFENEESLWEWDEIGGPGDRFKDIISVKKGFPSLLQMTSTRVS